MEEDFPNFSLEFNFPSIQETAKKPNEQQQQASRFPSLQEEASHCGFLRLSRVLPTSHVFTSGYVNMETILHFFSEISNF